ncbi:MAG: Uma2 family endonuclease [Elainellaceae cyanobacterium]
MTAHIRSITLAEFLKLPETKPANEYFEGQIYQRGIPQGKHSTLQSRLVNTINAAGFPNRVAYAFPELRCTLGGRSIVPDVAVFQWAHIPFDVDGEIANIFERAPDWMIEIFLPDQSPTRMIDNIAFSVSQGTQVGWLIDPDEKAVVCFQPNQAPHVKRRADESLPVPNFLNLELTVGRVFDWLKLGEGMRT